MVGESGLSNSKCGRLPGFQIGQTAETFLLRPLQGRVSMQKHFRWLIPTTHRSASDPRTPKEPGVVGSGRLTSRFRIHFCCGTRKS